jgi:hypothetical protein
MKKSNLALASRVAVACLAASSERSFAQQLPLMPVPSSKPRNRTTSMNYEVQKQVYEAAQAKRARRQARNLANAGLTQEATL